MKMNYRTVKQMVDYLDKYPTHSFHILLLLDPLPPGYSMYREESVFEEMAAFEEFFYGSEYKVDFKRDGEWTTIIITKFEKE